MNESYLEDLREEYAAQHPTKEQLEGRKKLEEQKKQELEKNLEYERNQSSKYVDCQYIIDKYNLRFDQKFYTGETLYFYFLHKTYDVYVITSDDPEIPKESKKCKSEYHKKRI